MPKYNYQFHTPAYIEEGIWDDNGKKIGTLRIKPVSLSWKSVNAQEFRTVPLDKFIEWITSSDANAKRTKS